MGVTWPLPLSPSQCWGDTAAAPHSLRVTLLLPLSAGTGTPLSSSEREGEMAAVPQCGDRNPSQLGGDTAAAPQPLTAEE